MADSRIKDLTTTAISPASDDFLVLDGAGNGTRKISANTATLLPALGGMAEDEIEAFTYNLTNSRRPTQGLVFDGTAGATVTLASALGTSGATAAGWATWGGGARVLLSALNGFEVYVTAAGSFRVYSYVSSADIATTPDGTITAGKSFSWAYNRAQIYINGVAVGSPVTDSDNYTATAWKVGSSPTPASFWSGTLGQVLIYNAALSAAEVATLAETGRPATVDLPSAVGQPAGVGLLTGDDSDFDTDTGFWTKSSATISGGSCTLSAGGYIQRTGFIAAKYTNLRIAVTLTSGSIQVGNGATYVQTINASGTYDFSYGAGNGQLSLYSAAGAVIDTVQITPLGCVLATDPDQPGSGNVWRNINGTGDVILPSTGVRWALPTTQLERADILTRTQSSARRQMIQLSGAQGRSTATLGFDIGTAPFDLLKELQVPLVNPSAFQAIEIYSSTGGEASYSLNTGITTAGALQVTLYGVAPSNYRIGTVANFVSMYDGHTVKLRIKRDSSAGLYISTDGKPEIITITTAGTDPTWAGTISSTYADYGTINGNLDFAGYINPSLLLGNLSTTESDRWHATGEFPAWARVAGGAGVQLVTGDNSTFASDTLWWTKSAGVTINNASDGKAVLPGAGYIVRNSLFTVGKKYGVWLTNTAGSGNVDVYFGDGLYVRHAYAASMYFEAVCTTNGNLTIQAGVGGLTVDTITAVPLGLAFHPDERWDGRGGVWPDVSGASRHLTLATSGVTPAVLGYGDVYATIAYADASAVQSIPAGATYTKLTAFTTNVVSNGCIADAANDKITLTIPGVYKVSGSYSSTVGTNNVTLKTTIFLGGVEQSFIHCQRKFASAGDTGAGPLNGQITVTSVPVDLDVRVRHDNVSAVDLTAVYGSLTVERKN